MHEGSRAISKELPPARERGGRGQASRDAGTDTGCPRSPPQAKGLRSAPRFVPRPADPRPSRWLRGARSSEPPPSERGTHGCLASLPFGFLSLFSFSFLLSFFFLEAPRPLFGRRAPRGRPSPGFLRFLFLGMCLAIVVACVINCTRTFPCSLRDCGLNWL